MRVAFKCYIEPLGKGNKEISRLEKKNLTLLAGDRLPRREISIAPNMQVIAMRSIARVHEHHPCWRKPRSFFVRTTKIKHWSPSVARIRRPKHSKGPFSLTTEKKNIRLKKTGHSYLLHFVGLHLGWAEDAYGTQEPKRENPLKLSLKERS